MGIIEVILKKEKKMEFGARNMGSKKDRGMFPNKSSSAGET